MRSYVTLAAHSSPGGSVFLTGIAKVWPAIRAALQVIFAIIRIITAIFLKAVPAKPRDAAMRVSASWRYLHRARKHWQLPLEMLPLQCRIPCFFCHILEQGPVWLMWLMTVAWQEKVRSKEQYVSRLEDCAWPAGFKQIPVFSSSRKDIFLEADDDGNGATAPKVVAIASRSGLGASKVITRGEMDRAVSNPASWAEKKLLRLMVAGIRCQLDISSRCFSQCNSLKEGSWLPRMHQIRVRAKASWDDAHGCFGFAVESTAGLKWPPAQENQLLWHCAQVQQSVCVMFHHWLGVNSLGGPAWKVVLHYLSILEIEATMVAIRDDTHIHL